MTCNHKHPISEYPCGRKKGHIGAHKWVGTDRGGNVVTIKWNDDDVYDFLDREIAEDTLGLVSEDYDPELETERMPIEGDTDEYCETEETGEKE